MVLSRPRLIISALKGGAGKTTVSLALAAAWRSQGLQVAPFKKGPDYIDAGWLCRASGFTCRNLDPHLMGWDGARLLFDRTTDPDTIALIEGNRGLYDGLDRAGSLSTAELAKRLRAPVVVVLDCTKSTRTVAALVYGLQKYDPEVNLAGVILNRIAGPRHENLIKDCLADIGVPVLGAIKKIRRDMPERHMGLVPTQEHPEVVQTLDWLAELGRTQLDLDRLLDLARSAGELKVLPAEEPPPREVKVKIGVIRDSAFQFYYPENLEALSAAGAELIYLSAISDRTLPRVDGIYIGGGFPETQAQFLAANESFRTSLASAAERGLPIYAECGGLMYLAQTLIMDGRPYPMAGVLPLTIEVGKRPRGHGYTVVTVDRPNPFYPVGTELKGHEFHYSWVSDLDGLDDNLAFNMDRGVGIKDGRDGIVKGSVLATYTHIHAVGTPAWAEGLVAAAADWAAKQPTDRR